MTERNGAGLEGRVHRLNVSRGGVPKTPVAGARVTREGIAGDVQGDRRHHGGPERAVSLFSLDLITRLREEGHPIGPGTAGENVTVEGLDWTRVVPGARLAFEGGVVLEVSSHCVPCGKIRSSFAGGEIRRIDQRDRPGESRLYARVVTEGTLREGETVRLEAAPRG